MGQSLGRVVNTADWVFPTIPATYDRAHKRLVFVPCESVGVKIPAMLLSPGGVCGEERRALSSTVTVCAIYFHPNAVDIGDCLEDMEAICDGAYGGDAAVLAPEYPGYGLLNEFEPSVEGLDLVAAAAWRYCVGTLGFAGERVMLWGRSIGCGPAASLALGVASGRLVGCAGAKEQRGARSKTRPKDLTEADPPPSPPPRSVAPPAPMSPKVNMRKVSSPPPQPTTQTDSDSEETNGAQAPGSLAVGALVLIAPYLSISAVVEHHTASPFLASVVGPMWEILEIVKNEVMKEVPLCILHPKEDEIIPSSHGLQIYQQSNSRKKYGVWLSNATHNFQPEEDHFTLVKAFLSSVVASRGVSPPAPQASCNGGAITAAALKAGGEIGLCGAGIGRSIAVSGVTGTRHGWGGPDSAAGTAMPDVDSQEPLDQELQALAARMISWGDLEHWSSIVNFSKEGTSQSEPAEQKAADVPVDAEEAKEAIAAGKDASLRISLGGSPSRGGCAKEGDLVRAGTPEPCPLDFLGAVAAGAREATTVSAGDGDVSAPNHTATSMRSATSATL